MKLTDLNEMMLNPMTIMKCKKLQKEKKKLNDAAGMMQDDSGFHKRYQEIQTEIEELGCKPSK